MQHRGQLNTMYTACSSHASLRGGAIKRWDPFDGVRGRNQSSCDLPCKKICSFGETVDSFGWTQLGTTDQWPCSMWVPMASHCSWPKGTLIADKKSRASVAAVKERPGIFTFLTHPYISLVTGTTQCRVRYTAGWVEKNERTMCCKNKVLLPLDSSGERKFTFTSREIAVLLSTLLVPLPDPFFFAAAAFLHDLGPRHLTCLCGPSRSVFFCRCRLTSPLILAMFFPFLLLPRSIFFVLKSKGIHLNI
jgi:hypothetical protein